MSDAVLFCCPSCGGVEGRISIAAAGETSSMLQCKTCAAEMFWPVPSNEELSNLYSRGHSLSRQGSQSANEYLQKIESYRNLFRKSVDYMRNLGLRDSATYVDLGCSYGQNTIELRRLGYDAWGVDYSEEGIAWLNEHGGKGYCGSITDEEFPLKSIDYLYSSHALEHMPDPYAVLRHIHCKMSKGGILHLCLPHWGSCEAKIQVQNWKWYGYPTHLHYFDQRYFPSILNGLGFEPFVVASSHGIADVDGVLEAIGVERTSVGADARSVIEKMLELGRLGENLHVVARRVELPATTKASSKS